MKPTSLRVAAVQLRFRANVAENAENLARWVRKLARRGIDAVLFPECATTGYAADFAALSRSEVEAGLKVVATAARDARCHVLVGSPTFEGRRRFNSLLVYDRRGREVFRYSKIHLTERDGAVFRSGNRLAFFPIDGIPCTAIICHERRYPELVRLPVMMGAQIVFHPNAGLDALKVSKAKRSGKDGIAVRAFENQVHYVFANSVGPQGGGLWSAGDSKIVAANSEVLALADNRREMAIRATLDLSMAGRKYAREALEQPVMLRKHWRAMLAACRRAL
ncbi:MAG: carbon-nitrogen hydrolase family protein [Verrucomicrobiales bacterium]|nr:carbon-nitrogen hydrolase family protein [Verrucomicrobiales bacterium]